MPACHIEHQRGGFIAGDPQIRKMMLVTLIDTLLQTAALVAIRCIFDSRSAKDEGCQVDRQLSH